MIISKNIKPSIEDFSLLMKHTDELLNLEAKIKEDYYAKRNGNLLEEDVFEALCRCSKNTVFENTIELVSGASFPDIIANRFYGVEVKSTIKNHWKSIGSSILESTRDQNVERIFLTFGKLGKPVQFLSKPYEECLSGISVTHYPRYQIDMELKKGETIFDRLGISYDELRKMDNPVVPVSKYYKSLLKPGESLWWAMNDSEEDSASPPILKLWTSLVSEEKNIFTVKGYALFPEILNQKSTTKYQRYALWLAKSCSVINTNIRDQFSAGGKTDIVTKNGIFPKMPASFGRIAKYKDLIKNTIENTTTETLKDFWQVSEISDNIIKQWCDLITKYSAQNQQDSKVISNMLYAIFDIQ